MSERRVSLGPMVDLTVAIRGNLFDTNESGRTLIGEITDSINRHESREYQAHMAEQKRRDAADDVRLASTVNSDSPDSKEEEKGGN